MITDNFFFFLGAAGMVLVIAGVLAKSRTTEHILYIFGGLCLEGYSISIRNTIFILLQAIFILSALYDIGKSIKQNNHTDGHSR